MISADFEYYIGTFHGLQIHSAAELDALVHSAQMFLVELTDGRFLNYEFNDETVVKNCLCMLAEYEHKDAQRTEINRVASENVGGHSRSYNTAATAKTNEQIYEEKSRIAFACLLSTGIFYHGVLNTCSRIR